MDHPYVMVQTFARRKCQSLRWVWWLKPLASHQLWKEWVNSCEFRIVDGKWLKPVPSTLWLKCWTCRPAVKFLDTTFRPWPNSQKVRWHHSRNGDHSTLLSCFQRLSHAKHRMGVESVQVKLWKYVHNPQENWLLGLPWIAKGRRVLTMHHYHAQLPSTDCPKDSESGGYPESPRVFAKWTWWIYLTSNG